jgi:U4/U6.U5 tri-snRNP component SNU23
MKSFLHFAELINMSSNLSYKQAANVERRTWDKEKYEAKANARKEAEHVKLQDSKESLSSGGDGESQLSGQKRQLSETILNDKNDRRKEEFLPANKGRAGPLFSKRAFLKARTNKVDLDSKVGTSEIINSEQASTSSVRITDGVSQVNGSEGVGWYCKVCDCYLKDSLTYLDHINGRKHQRALGYSMRTEKSTTEEVTNRLQSLAEARKKLEEEESKNMLTKKEPDDEEDEINAFDEIVKKKDEEIMKRKQDRAKRREERRKKNRELKCQPPTNMHQEKKQNEQCDDDGHEEESDGINPDLAKLMGFNNFG